MTPAELTTILGAHGKYLRGEPGGERANLEGAYLEGANLEGANGILYGVEVVITADMLRVLGACIEGVQDFARFEVERAIVDPRGLWALAIGEENATLSTHAAWLCSRLGMGLHPSVSTAEVRP